MIEREEGRKLYEKEEESSTHITKVKDSVCSIDRRKNVLISCKHCDDKKKSFPHQWTTHRHHISTSTSFVRSGAFKYPAATPTPPIHSSPSEPPGSNLLGAFSSSDTM